MMKDLRVHIVPLGYDTFRLTKPLEEDKVDKVYLIMHKEVTGYSKYRDFFIENIMKSLPTCEIIVMKTDLWNLYELICLYREIIGKESDNQIKINISSGSKITAISGMLVSMVLDKVTPYYAHVEYEQEKKKLEKIRYKGKDDLPIFKISTPEKASRQLLSLIKPGTQISKTDLADKLVKEKIIVSNNDDGSKPTSHAKLGQLNSILQRLTKLNYIRVIPRGKKRLVEITEEGENALKIFGSK